MNALHVYNVRFRFNHKKFEDNAHFNHKKSEDTIRRYMYERKNSMSENTYKISKKIGICKYHWKSKNLINESRTMHIYSSFVTSACRTHMQHSKHYIVFQQAQNGESSTYSISLIHVSCSILIQDVNVFEVESFLFYNYIQSIRVGSFIESRHL